MRLLTISEVAEWLKLSEAGVRTLIKRGRLRRGVHYVRPPGMTIRFKEDALQQWLDERDQKKAESESASIKMAKGYKMK